jgi:arylformamidase
VTPIPPPARAPLTEPIRLGGRKFVARYDAPIDISIPPSPSGGPSAFGARDIEVHAVTSIQGGDRCNCFTVSHYAPHLHGTHIETQHHLSAQPHGVVGVLERFRFIARLVSVTPEEAGDRGLTLVGAATDRVVTQEMIALKLRDDPVTPEVLIVRTPDLPDKTRRHYGGTNPPYLHHALAAWCIERGIEHIVVDLPSVDREHGELYFHRTFWQNSRNAVGEPIVGLGAIPGPIRERATITELAYIPPQVSDGWYLAFFIPVGFPGDAAPVRPLLVPLTPVG